MSAAVEGTGTGKETFYTSHGVRLGKIVAFNPRDSKWYLRAMKYKPSGGGYWAKKGDRIVSSKKGLWWGSKEEAMQLDRKVAASTAASNPGGGAWQITAKTGGTNEEGSSTSAGKVSGARRQRA
jgi:hypothetical protein